MSRLFPLAVSLLYLLAIANSGAVISAQVLSHYTRLIFEVAPQPPADSNVRHI